MITTNYEALLPQYNTFNLSAKEAATAEKTDKNVQNIVPNTDLKEQNQEQKEAKRQYFVAALGHQSKTTQAEIYLSVALEENISLGNDTSVMIESLEKTQQQNRAVQAYAAYQENNNPLPQQLT